MDRKVDVNNLVRPRRVPTTRRVYKDATNPGAEIILYWRALDPIEEERVQERGMELSAYFVMGGFMSPKTQEWMKDPLLVTSGDGEPININRKSCFVVAQIEAMNCPPDPALAYSPEELFNVAVCMPEAWEQIKSDVVKFSIGEGWEKKDSGVGVETQPASA